MLFSLQIAIILVLVTGCLGCTLSGFAIFHCRLIAQGITTNEYLKGRQADVEDKGCVVNCHNVYCTKLPESKLDLQGPALLMEMKEEKHDTAEQQETDNARNQRPPSDSELGRKRMPDNDSDLDG